VSEMERRSSARSAAILPLGFRGQTIDSAGGLLSLKLRKPVAKIVGVIPRELLRGMVWATTVGRREVRRIRAHDRFVFPLRDFVDAQEEGLRDSYLVLRPFVG